jgi:hypothetical protein
MTVPNDIFSQAPPVSYDVARTQIRNGDIALFAGREPMSRLIEHFTESTFCHVGYIWRMDAIDRIMLLESVENAGVRMLPLSSKMNGGMSGKPYNGQLLVARHDDFPLPGPAFDEAFGKMTRFAVDRLGCPYDPEEIGMIGVSIAANLAGFAVPNGLKPNNAYICSEYAEVCYSELGIKIPRARADFIYPADFANDPKVKAVVGIRPD